MSCDCCDCEELDITEYTTRELESELKRRGGLPPEMLAASARSAIERGDVFGGLLELERWLGHEWSGLLTRLVKLPEAFEFRKEKE